MNDVHTLLEALHHSCDRALALVNTLDDAQLNVPCLPGINPPVWELGHAAFFFERFVLKPLDGAASIQPALDEIWDSFELAHEDRWIPGLFPGRSDTVAYFSEVRRRVAERIASRPLTDADVYLYRYAVYHLNMHIESMIWCRQTLGYPPPPPASAGPYTASPAPADLPAERIQPTTGPATTHAATAMAGIRHSDDITIPVGRYRIGISASTAEWARDDFGFDNEKPGFTIELPEFRISRTLVSNGEFAAFVKAGGYENPDYWSRGGRRWLARHGQPHPMGWQKDGTSWKQRLFDTWLPVNPDAPVQHVSYWEAQAFCRYAGRRLPTEAEWEAAALGNREGEAARRFPWGPRMDVRQVDMDCTARGQLPVDALPGSDSPFGCRQMIGTVWEWTADTFLPYNGFSVDMYPFMSTLQFGTHKVVRGGSWATSSLLIRGTYRQAYMPDRNDVFTGFRTCAA